MMPTPQPSFDDANLILRLYELRRDDRMREARKWFAGNFRPQSIEEMMAAVPFGSGMNESFRMVTSYWEMAASFVTSGVLNPELFFESNQELMLVYLRVKPVLAAYRAAIKNPKAMANLETVALQFTAWWEDRAPGALAAFGERVK